VLWAGIRWIFWVVSHVESLPRESNFRPAREATRESGRSDLAHEFNNLWIREFRNSGIEELPSAGIGDFQEFIGPQRDDFLQ
jgi:hypothetical protein